MRPSTMCPISAADTVARHALRYEGLTAAARPVLPGNVVRQPASTHAPNRRARRSQRARTRVRLVAPASGAPSRVQTVAETQSARTQVRPARPDRAVMSQGGFVKIASMTAFGAPTDISVGWDGTVWAIDASGAPHLLDLLNDRWQPFGEGVDATAAAGGSVFYFRGEEVLEIPSGGAAKPPVPIRTRFPGLPDSFNYGLSGAVAPGGALYLIRAGWYVPASASSAKARLTDLKNWPKLDPVFGAGLIDAAWDDGTAAFLARDGQFIKVNFAAGEVVGAPAPLSQYAPWAGKLPDGWAARGIDAALWQAPSWVVFNGPAVAAFDNQKATPGYLGARIPGWPMAWNPTLVQAPSGRLGALVSLLAGQVPPVIFYDGKTWSQTGGGAAYSVCQGADGSVFATSNQLYYLNNGVWHLTAVQPPRTFTRVTAGNESLVYGVDSSGVVYRTDGPNFQATTWGPATDIAAGSDGTFWSCRNGDNRAYLGFWELPDRAPMAVPVVGAGGVVLRIATCGLSQVYALARHGDGSPGVYRYDLPYLFRSQPAPGKSVDQMVRGRGRLYRLDTTKTPGAPWRVAALDAHTGEQLASFDLPALPVGEVYWSLAYDPVHDLVYAAARPWDPFDRTSRGELLALDGATLDRRWWYMATKGIDAAPAVAGGAVYFGDRSGTLTKIDGLKGPSVAWTWQIWDPAPTNVMRVTTPLVAGGMVYAVAWIHMGQASWWGGVVTCTTDGTQRFASKDHGFWITSETIIYPMLAPPILGRLADGGKTVPVLYLTSRDSIVAYKLGSSGMAQPASFTLPGGAAISAAPTYDDGTRAGSGLSGQSLDSKIRIWFGDDRGRLWALDRGLVPVAGMPKTIAEKSNLQTSPQLYKDARGGLTVLFGLLYDGPAKGGHPYLYGYNPDTGDVSTIPTGGWDVGRLCHGVLNGIAYCAGFAFGGPIFAMRVDTIVQGLRDFLVDSQMMQDPDETAANYNRTDSPIPPSRARYQTHLTVIDDQKSPIPHEPLKVWADAPTTIRVDGKPYTIGPGANQYAALQTGTDGSIVITSGYSLADGSDKPDMYASALHVWAGFMDPFERIVVNPDHLFHERIATAHANAGDDDPDKVNLMTAQSYACVKPNSKPAGLFTADDKTNKQPENCAKAIGQMRSGVGFGGSPENAPGMLFDRLMLHAGGTKQARRAIRAGLTADAGGSSGRYIAAEKPPEAAYFPANIAARRPVTLSKANGMLFTKPQGVHANKTVYREVDHATAQDEFDKLGPSTWQPIGSSSGTHRLGNIFTDFWHWLTHVFNEVVDEITHIVVSIADAVMVGIRMIIKGVEQVFKAIITVIDDIASAIGSFFRMLAKIVEDVIAALSVFFHFDRILAVQRFLNTQINGVLAQTGGTSKIGAAISQHVKPIVDNLINGGEQAVKNAFDPVIAKLTPNDRLGNMPGAGATPHSIFLAKRGSAGPNSGGATHAVHCTWGLQKAKSGLPSATVGAAAVAGGDDPLTAFFKSFVSSLSSDPVLRQAIAQLTTQVDATFHVSSAGDFFRGLLADLLRLLEVVTILALDIAKAFFDGLFALIESLVGWVGALLNQAIDIPVLSWLFGWLTGGEKLTLLNLITLIGAIPITLLYRVVEGTWPDVSQASDAGAPAWLRFAALTIAGFDSLVVGFISGVLDAAGDASEEALARLRVIAAAASWVRVAAAFPLALSSSPLILDWSLWVARICSALWPTFTAIFKAEPPIPSVVAGILGFSAGLLVVAVYLIEGASPLALAAGLCVSIPPALNWGKLFGEEAAIIVGMLDVAMGFAVCGLDIAMAVPSTGTH